jgi:hypothetical protein
MPYNFTKYIDTQTVKREINAYGIWYCFIAVLLELATNQMFFSGNFSQQRQAPRKMGNCGSRDMNNEVDVLLLT